MTIPLSASSPPPTDTSGNGPAAAPKQAPHPKVAAAVEAWKRKLLDLTKRNRALNFKATRVSTVEIRDSQPADVFDSLYLRERPMQFLPLPEPANSEPSLALQGWSPETEDDDEPDSESSPSSGQNVDVRPERDPMGHVEGLLQTTSRRDQLEKSLRRLSENARLSIEEQGVNTLFLALGMLHYTESDDSSLVLRAPLVLLPVSLARKSANAPFALSMTDDDPVVNTALCEELRQSYGIALPDLPDSETVAEDCNLSDWLSGAADVIQARANWSITPEIYLGQFSFQKFAMYKDLEANVSALADHRLIGLLTGVVPSEHAGGMPTDIENMDLDRDYAPEHTCQVVDADSSQLRAIAAASRNHDLVLEGPPGTGKSQTITNLIAQALGAGKTVLFVAEKMAALQVVYGRLADAGLADCCLELHSTKANKRAVMEELKRSLDQSVSDVPAPHGASERLGAVRSTLTDYVRALHAPYGKLSISPFAGYGALALVYLARRVKYDGPVDSLTKLDIDRTERELRDLAANAGHVGVPSLNPWRDSTKAFFSEDDQETVRELGSDLLRRLGELQSRIAKAVSEFGTCLAESFGAVDLIKATANILASSPGAPVAVLASEIWDSPPTDALALIARGRALSQLRDRVTKRLSRDVLDATHRSDIEYVEDRAKGLFAFTAILSSRYRAIKKRWLAYRLPSFKGSLVEQAAEMRYVDNLVAERDALIAADATGRGMFGALWNGADSSWDALGNYVAWVVEFRRVYRDCSLLERAITVAARPAPNVDELRALTLCADDAASTLHGLQGVVGWPTDYLVGASFSQIESRVRDLIKRVDEGPRWAAFEVARRAVANGAARSLLPDAMSGEIPCADLPAAFLRAFYSKWLSAAVSARPELAAFHTMSHEERVAEFRTLDKRVLHDNRHALMRQLRNQVQEQIRHRDLQPAMGFLRKQMAKQRGLASLRRTLREAGPAIRAIKPCLMMSPLTVAQFLSGQSSAFDLVIFDEASQLPPEDAVGAIMRGKQLVVVGDPKQLPPTNFFRVFSDTSDVPVADDGTPLYEDSESILEEFQGVGMPNTRLKWHYRSVHESLIHFSNVNFYDSDLVTFPSADRRTDTSGLQFEFVPDGMYEGKGLNRAEARRVADAVVAFAKEQERRRTKAETVWSLGVGTFNMRQQLAIQDELEQRRRSDPSLETFFGSAHEPFFVKNLENIQGDERDVIFLSVTYAKAEDGRLRQNFGPVNGENGWRRLNVITTRARRRMRVFSSMHGDDISVSATTSVGARLLREFLLFAERGRLESAASSLSADTESPFERDVLAELTRRGFNVVPQVGVSGYRVDLGVVDDRSPGKFLCGIECDGVAYHSSRTARDRDRLRQEVLEKRGWTIFRIWSTDFFKDRKGEVERISALIENCRELALEAPTPDSADSDLVGKTPPADVGALDDADSVSVPKSEGGGNGYRRPVAAPYELAAGQGKYAGQDITTTSLEVLTRAIVHVVSVESPIHADDLMTRLVGMWDTRAGRRIATNVGRVIDQVERAGQIQRRENYFWNRNGTCIVRSRAGTNIPGDRISPAEYELAIRQVLLGGYTFPRPDLIAEVRAVFGFNRTGAILDAAIGSVIDRMLADGALGETSGGIRRRDLASTANPEP